MRMEAPMAHRFGSVLILLMLVALFAAGTVLAVRPAYRVIAYGH